VEFLRGRPAHLLFPYGITTRSENDDMISGAGGQLPSRIPIPPSNEVSAPPSLTAAEAAELLKVRLLAYGIKADVHANDGAALLSVCAGLTVWAYSHGYGWENGTPPGQPDPKLVDDPSEAAMLVAARYKKLTGRRPTIPEPERRPLQALYSRPAGYPPQPAEPPHSDTWTNSPWS
jgi:hypothetical protein